ncbi:MAG: hypothetical protein JO235_20860 [Chroococcidiopsidaceae cyanobacterium CP_BM_RX_35]|nr:hypothetical protein [Chroococcidiopsidaceae cyanobacterium CP_BM_RX_35]
MGIFRTLGHADNGNRAAISQPKKRAEPIAYTHAQFNSITYFPRQVLSTSFSQESEVWQTC